MARPCGAARGSLDKSRRKDSHEFLAWVVEEVVRDDPHPRYRIRWDDGHESIYTPAAGALRLAEPAGRSA
ncbi:MAG: DUF1918 domain-containing protein [Actinobacteria bacterium]|nr:DUF1918 domain-containing protein [Actinomycetota bacterium]